MLTPSIISFSWFLISIWEMRILTLFYFTGEKILLSSLTAADTFDDPVFEDASEFAETLETVQLTDLIEEASASPASEFDEIEIDLDILLSSDSTDKSDNEAVLDFDDTDLEMYIQSSNVYANAHSRQPSIQNYGHVNGLRQSGYLPHHHHHPQVSFLELLCIVC